MPAGEIAHAVQVMKPRTKGRSWHGLFHLVPALLGIAVASRPELAARWSRSVVALYLTAGIWGTPNHRWQRLGGGRDREVRKHDAPR